MQIHHDTRHLKLQGRQHGGLWGLFDDEPGARPTVRRHTRVATKRDFREELANFEREQEELLQELIDYFRHYEDGGPL